MMPDELLLITALLLLLLPVVFQMNARTEDSAPIDNKIQCVDRTEVAEADNVPERGFSGTFAFASYRTEPTLDSVNAP